MRNKNLIKNKKRYYTRMAVLQSYRLGKGRGKKKKNRITTRGIHIWSPNQVLKPPNRA